MDEGEVFHVTLQRTVQVRATSPRAARKTALQGEPQGTHAPEVAVERPGRDEPSEVEAVAIALVCDDCEGYATEDDDREGWAWEDGSGAIYCPACEAKREAQA